MRIHWAHDDEGGVSIAEVGFSHTKDAAVKEQFDVLMQALLIYQERNGKYKDNWRRFGWRGCLFRVRERAERLWDNLWDATPLSVDAMVEPPDPHGPHRLAGGADSDDALDCINLLGFLVRAIRSRNRDGEWW